jgi:hypothetical protein
MAVVYVGSFPFDPEIERQNFERKQAEYEGAYRSTGDPLFAYEALRHARAARQLPREFEWLVGAFGNTIQKIRHKGTRKGRPSQALARFRERMGHVQRYRCVRDLRGPDRPEDDAFDLAVAILEKKGAATASSTIRDSYYKVKCSLDRLGPGSEFYTLVVRSDPTVVPVLKTKLPDGTTLINGKPVRTASD